MKKLVAVMMAFLFVASAFSEDKIDHILVYKNERKMILLSKNQIIKEYNIALSIAHNNPLFEMGPKRLRGDQRTPEGEYKIVKKRVKTGYPKSLLINYPNEKDIEWGKANGYSKNELGDLILIHGFPYRPNSAVRNFVSKFGVEEDTLDSWLRDFFYPNFDWTNGCMAVTDEEMNEIFDLIEEGTPITIKRYENESRSHIPNHLEAYPISYY
ncbi:L,D-transpeptidase catalytic domain protein [Bacteriovorax sp. BSW11_IV]|uniref:L,D-transpeptidase family protein n=1 Tax=Bacteriovorax sp. BSW11_IV TaxID=1353529 RepID=UPI000389EB8E|nr:L,D-transpeptidase family protein [Bacteriovorax sp. BSW11_IV]EQC48799.1 L,D-transpeptidase catalytic domain protein [Bacteriovorax sp. BSW11_IV]